MAGLRERWRRDAMQTIQERALDLFDEHGFAAVTIEQIAAAAEVSPSSIYRYFGTKEGLLVADDFDAMEPERLTELLATSDPVDFLLDAVRAYEATGGEDPAKGPWRRVRYFFTVPSVKLAVFASLDRASARITPALAADGRLSAAQARVVANALAFGYVAALELWFDDGGTRPIASYVEEGLRPLRAVWAAAADR